MIKNFIFDIDGTLLDSKDMYFNSLQLALEEHGIYRTVLSEDLFSLPAKEALKRLCITDINGLLETWGKHFNSFNCDTLIYEGVIEVIEKLHNANKKIAIVTSRNREVANYFCHQTKLNKYIDFCVCSEDTNNHKPHPEPLLFALNKLNLEASETVYIGDTLNDYYAANEANIFFIAAAWNDRAANLPGCKIYTPLDLLKI